MLLWRTCFRIMCILYISKFDEENCWYFVAREWVEEAHGMKIYNKIKKKKTFCVILCEVCGRMIEPERVVVHCASSSRPAITLSILNKSPKSEKWLKYWVCLFGLSRCIVSLSLTITAFLPFLLFPCKWMLNWKSNCPRCFTCRVHSAARVRLLFSIWLKWFGRRREKKVIFDSYSVLVLMDICLCFCIPANIW